MDGEEDDDAATGGVPATGADGGDEERDARFSICLCRCSLRECCRTRSARVRGAELEPNADVAPPIALRLSLASDDCGLKVVAVALCNEPPPLLSIDIEDAKVPNPEPCTTGGYDNGGVRDFAEAWKTGEGGNRSNKIIDIGNETEKVENVMYTVKTHCFADQKPEQTQTCDQGRGVKLMKSPWTAPLLEFRNKSEEFAFINVPMFPLGGN